MRFDGRITVVVPTKDRPELLARTVATVLAQVDVDLRVIVVDDGSAVPADGVWAQDPRVQVVRHDTARGVSAARNHGLALAETPWVALLDDDDLWSPHKLRRQLDAVRGSACRWVCSATVSFSGSQVLDVADPARHGDLSRTLLTGNVVPGSASSVLVSTDLARAVGGFDETLPSLEDWDFWLRLAQESPLAAVTSPDVAYRVHATSMSFDLSDQRRALQLMQDKYARRIPALHVEPDLHFLQYWARIELRSGHWAAGLRRTGMLVVGHRSLRPAVTAVGAALPESVQRRLRSRRLARRARELPDQDWSWLTPHLRST